MTYGYDDVTTTSLGTGVAETQLNSGTSLSAPDPAHAFLACIPYQSESAAFTVDQSLLTAFRIQCRWREANEDPKYELCRKRLNRDYNALFEK